MGAVGACGLSTIGTGAGASSLTEGVDAATLDASSEASGTTGGTVEGGNPNGSADASADARTDGGTSAVNAGSQAYLSAVLSDGPIAFYRLGEATGSSANPEPPTTAQTGTYASAALGKPGAIVGDPNTAVSFSGSGTSVLNLHGQFDFINGAAFTIELWANPPSLDNDYENLFLKESSPSGIRQGYGLIVDASGYYKVERFVSNVQASVLATSKVATNAFTYLVMTYDGTNLSLYVDGVLQGQAPSAPNAVSQPTQDTVVGNGNGYPYTGVVDEVAVYDKALAVARITAHYKAATNP